MFASHGAIAPAVKDSCGFSLMHSWNLKEKNILDSVGSIEDLIQ